MAISSPYTIKVGDTVRIIGHSRHVGKTGVVRHIQPGIVLSVSVEIDKFLYFFSYTEVVKV